MIAIKANFKQKLNLGSFKLFYGLWKAAQSAGDHTAAGIQEVEKLAVVKNLVILSMHESNSKLA